MSEAFRDYIAAKDSVKLTDLDAALALAYRIQEWRRDQSKRIFDQENYEIALGGLKGVSNLAGMFGLDMKGNAKPDEFLTQKEIMSGIKKVESDAIKDMMTFAKKGDQSTQNESTGRYRAMSDIKMIIRI